jgi:hypothetical protein
MGKTGRTSRKTTKGGIQMQPEVVLLFKPGQGLQIIKIDNIDGATAGNDNGWAIYLA